MEPDADLVWAYCERLGSPALFAEPLNAATNAAFLLAALITLATARPLGRDRLAMALAGITALIGVGSFLFHTIPNRLTAMADVLPIQAFILTYVFLATRRFLGQSVVISLAATAGFFVAAGVFVAAMGSKTLGGSIGYVPALAALIGFGVAAHRHGGERERQAGRALFVAALFFTASLTLRTLDLPLCGQAPIGLHFAWHLLNAVVLGILMLAAVRQNRAL